LRGEEGLEAGGEIGALGILCKERLDGGNGFLNGGLPLSLGGSVEGGVIGGEAFGDTSLEGGDFHHGVAGFGALGVFFDEFRVVGDRLVGFGEVDGVLCNRVVSEEDLVILRILFDELPHEGVDLIDFLVGGKKLGPHEVGIWSGLAGGEFFGEEGEGGDAFGFLSGGDLGTTERVRGERGEGMFFIGGDEGLEERDGGGVVALLLGGDGDPVIGLHGLRRAGKFVFDDFVSGMAAALSPFCWVAMAIQ